MDDRMGRVVFLLLGNIPTIPYSECISILQSNKMPFTGIRKLDQVLILSSPVEACRVVMSQAGMVRRGCILLAESSSSPSSILRALDNVVLDAVLKPQMSFAVRVKVVKEHSKGANISELEKEMGGRIKKRIKWSRVDLENPDVLFYTIITDHKALLCLSLAVAEEKGFTQRRPGFRPFFHPSSMHPRLARAMVNLSGVKSGSKFLDPFCGSGGILLEAGIIGCEVIGIDIDPAMAKGSKTNLSAFGLRSANICVGDAQHIPVVDIDAVAADPPYGRSSSTKGRETSKLVEVFLSEVSSVLSRSGKVCLSLPSSIDVNALVQRNLKLVEVHSARVHRSLTRRIVVFLKK